MEGSRHEKAALIVASYAIGITTAFIFFSASSDREVVPDSFFSIPEHNSAAVIDSVSEEVQIKTPESNSINLSYTDGRLEVSSPEGIQLLSFNPEISGLNKGEEFPTQGVHYGEIVYKMSQDNKFVFFCEKQSLETSSCSGYVYEVAVNRIYQILKGGKPVTISPKSASEAIWTAIGLKVGSSYSANKSAPWVLISEDSKLDLQ